MASIKIKGDTSGSTTITAPATGGDESIELSTALAAKLPYSYGTATPSTTTDGFLWYDENDTPPTPKFWDGAAFQNVAPAGGLALVTSETISGSSISVNNCFTSDYANYRIIFRSTTTSNGAIVMRLRASGVDDSSSNYYIQRLDAYSTTTAPSRTTATNNFGPTTLISGEQATFAMDVFSPQLASSTIFQTFAFYRADSAAPEIQIRMASFATSSVFDGFTISQAGTMSGILRVYGYKD